MTDARSFETGAARSQHARRQIETGEDSVGVGVSQQETRIAAIAAGGVENALTAAHVERARTNKPAGQRLVTRQQPRHRRESAGQAVVVALNETPIRY